MRLRTQLLIVSLCIFILPWAGCQYIREMETVLIDGQSRALEASAHAISSHLQTQTQLLEHADAYKPGSQQQVYFHPLRSEPTLDGYIDGSLLPTLNSRTFVNANSPIPRLSLFAGIYRDYAYLIFEITDNAIEYHDPQQSVIASGDHIVLRLVDNKLGDNILVDNTQQVLTYFLRASGEGPFSARYINGQGQIRQEHRIRGHWAERTGGYTIEILIPLRVLGSHIDFSYVKKDGRHLGTLDPNHQPPIWVTIQPAITAILQIYSDQQTRIDVVDQRGWLLGQAGSLRETNGLGVGDTDWTGSFYRLVLGELDLNKLDNPANRGRMDSDEVIRALQGNVDTGLYQNNSQRVARTAVPIRIANQIVGAVVVEQSTDSLIAGTNTAFSRLFLYVGIALVAVFFSMFTYATALSLRIRRLSKAADNAIGDDGKINNNFIHSGFGDEIGDLTRSYGQLLSRLHDYTDYLRTLASKLSHELRTPLAVVRSSLDNLDDQISAADAEQYRQRAREGVERLGTILSAMSSASQMEDSIQHTPTETFQLDQLLNEVVAAYRSTYTNSKIKLQIDKSQGYSIYGSADLIVQMLDKLVDNAVDFCPDDGVIYLVLQRTKKSLVLSVSNSGPLLPQHMQGQLFDSLVSVRENKDQKTHLGLGLYIVRLIVDFHRGSVQARNLDDNSGVVFSIRFPV